MISSMVELPLIKTLLEKVRQLPVLNKILIIALADLLLCLFIVFFAYCLRLSALTIPRTEVLHLYLIAPILSVATNAFFEVYLSAARSHSANTELRILWAQIATAIGWTIFLLVFGTQGFARSIVVIYAVFSFLAMVLLRRAVSEIFTAGKRSLPGVQDKIIIFGASPEGVAVHRAIQSHKRYRPVAFIDTDYTLVGRNVAGLRVHAVEELESVLDKHNPKELVLAKGGLNRAGRRALVDQVSSRGIIVKTIPDQKDFLDGNIQFSEIRPVRVEDLLGRDPVPPDRKLMETSIKDQVVIVTGAGGSIGSEIARQAFDYGPKKLILVENSEYALFEIHRQLEARQVQNPNATCEIVPVLCDIREKSRVSAIMRDHAADIVFHAAAYKHVRMVQENAAAGINNNVYGTRALAEAAMEQKVKRFVLISTDKAVRPTSIMGASKRVAEMIVQAVAAEKKHNTIFSIVRFGNVLASTGSVVPLFREQIARGGPITVTHPDVTRYFMLITEAAQLVIQAAAMSEGGEVFVLDMGEPVRILDLAESMVELAGLKLRDENNPEGDIAIKFTGLHPGEKLYEELQIGSDVVGTAHPLIMRCNEHFLSRKVLSKYLDAAEKDQPILDVVALANS